MLGLKIPSRTDDSVDDKDELNFSYWILTDGTKDFSEVQLS